MSLRAHRETVRQGGTFLVVGLAATAVHAAASLAARDLGHLVPMMATTVGYLCAVGVSYLGNARITFGRPVLHGAQFARFLVVSLIGFAANLAITHVLSDRLHWPFPATLGIIVVVIPALSFTASKVWAFAERERGG
jgi:putative flippase GtrA